MPEKQEVNFLVAKEFYSYAWCDKCNGSGDKSHTFRNQKFIESCRACKGTGRIKLTRRTEVPLLEALKELNLVK